MPYVDFYNSVWEQRKLNEFVKNVAKKNKDNLDLEPFAVTNDRGFIAQKDAHEDFGYMKDTDRRAYNIVPPNSFAYNPARINVGSLGYYAGTENVIVSSLYEVFQTEDFIDDRFLWHWLKSEHFPKWIEKLQEGSVRLYFYFDKLIQCQMMIPSVEEQKKISEYLDRIDILITLHQRKKSDCVAKSNFVWEQRKLGEVLEGMQNNTLSRAELSNEQGNAKNIHYGDILVKFGEVLSIADERLPMIADNNIVVKYRASFLQNGDVIVADTAEDETVGKCTEIAGLQEETVISGLHTIPYRPLFKFASGYLGYYMNSNAYHNQLLPLMQGIKVTSISKSAMQSTDIVYPKSVEEQKKIGEYFLSLDTLITLHQCKCKKYQFNHINDWEQRKLGEYAEIVGGGTPSTNVSAYWDGDIDWYAPAEISDQIYLSSSQRKITEQGLNRSSAKMLPVGTVLFTSRAGIGKTAILSHVACTNQGFQSIVPYDGKLDSYFIFSRTDELKKYAETVGAGSTFVEVSGKQMSNMELMMPKTIKEQQSIGEYFCKLDTLITLHQCKGDENRRKGFFAWEQRKFEDCVDISTEMVDPTSGEYDDMPHIAPGNIESFTGRILDNVKTVKEEQLISGKFRFRPCDVVYGKINPQLGKYFFAGVDGLTSADAYVFNGKKGVTQKFLYSLIQTEDFFKYSVSVSKRSGMPKINRDELNAYNFFVPDVKEQEAIGGFLLGIDTLITLHQRKQNSMKNALKYTEILIFTVKETIIMPELEAIIEQKLIDQLVYGDSQWTYRADLKTENDLWANFKYILEQNNKDRLNGENLSDSEFEQVKNQLQFSSFYKAGEWLVGENGRVMVHVQRDTEKLHLVVMNHEHIAGGSSVYEVINQYSALKTDEDSNIPARDRRFDVTLMINGLPMIHIELKNKQHSYMDGFWQIKKYIGEGKFTGIFSAVQMFVISNGVNTKYFSAASDTELNPKFISGWLDKDNNPVADYLDFAKSVLRIPEAHEMIARYTVLDEDAKRLILLRPYQIHAIESIREASRSGKSGFVWHTTGSGKTLTSYKATRNLLMDIPAIDKAIFLIDRKDLDTQTTMAFQAYANNDLIDVDETDNVNDLKRKLKSEDRQVIVTTIQKLQRLITKRLTEGTPEYSKIKNLKIAFVVDECHRAVTPGTKRELERFFGNSLWFGFTGTPRFAENPYPQMGDLPRTTEELYGERLHKYTIQNAIHDNAVLGFQVEHNGPKNIIDETDTSAYDNEAHMLKVLDVILNKSYHKLGFQNGKGKTYEALLTTSSIQMAQKYYDLLNRIKKGETSLVIDEKIKQVLPDFPKFAITYSVSENEEGSHVNQQKMQQSLKEYNDMFDTKYEISQIQSYNGNLNKRLARKDTKFQSRQEQLDLVIVVDRLLTGFDAPCMSTIFIDRQPMGPHDLIQAFSRTNRIFDKNKTYGQIVTFQAPKLFKECVDNAVKLYSAGGTKEALMADWDEIEPAFKKALTALRVCAESPSEIPGMSLEEKKVFAKMFQSFDKLFAQLKSFTNYEDSMLPEYGITEEEYYDYAGHYLNVLEEIKSDEPDKPGDEGGISVVDQDYELMAYSNTKIDYEYIINLIQNIVTPNDETESITPEERQKKIEEVKQYVEELRKENPKVADIMSSLIYEIELDENKYKGQSILNIVETMKNDCIDKVITDFCITWYASKDDIMYAATHYRNGEIPNESAIKATVDFTSYKAAQERALPKFKYYTQLMAELKKTLEEEIKPLLSH